MNERSEKFKLAIERYKKDHDDGSGTYEFIDDGGACYWDSGCGGIWDGEDRRCNCGNRRVAWVYDEEDDRAYPEAW
jgi:hypothetical protein